MVEADAGGECEQSGRDAGGEVAWGAGAVSFEGEQVFAGPEDRLDPLSNRREVWPGLWLGLSGRPQDGGAEFGDGIGELAAGVALVADDRLAACERAR